MEIFQALKEKRPQAVLELLRNLESSKDKAVVFLVTRSRDFNFKRDTLLAFAAREGYSEIVEILLRLDSDPIHHIRLTNGFGITALMYATMKGHVNIARQLLEKDSDPVEHIRLQQDRLQQTALMYAASRGHAVIVDLLLEKDSALEHVRLQDRLGRTALIHATHGSHVAVVQQLLDRDSALEEHIQLRSKDKRTALIETIYRCDKAGGEDYKFEKGKPTLELLISYGATLSAEDEIQYKKLAKFEREFREKDKICQESISKELKSHFNVGGNLKNSSLPPIKKRKRVAVESKTEGVTSKKKKTTPSSL